ncbi:arginine/serine-rich protein PNISR-like isoform X1 [Quillaja saponaria]|uniref:Arginine/serine-rich protein PNISR-like isoform X1 n=1 Tax=Quillaja saponaria TaxID=32244 RepID=A0AAD7PIT8_QUISA|nr:arginine/serine-rich protein PNISR-like isoform X1 [Quillaja saponaria]
MEEEKAAAYYEELTRKGGGAARFKQGLGFSTTTINNDAPTAGSALPSSSSFLKNFVKASSPSKTSEFEKQAQLQSIQNKLKKKPTSSAAEETNPSRVSEKTHSRRRSVSRERDRERDSRRRRSRSRERYRDRGRDSRRRSRSRERYRRRKRSRSRSDSDEDRRHRERGRRRSLSPRDRRSERRSRSSEKNGGHGGDRRKVAQLGKEKNAGVDYARLIQGYDKMTRAERVKAKMKLQLSETAEKDVAKGMGSGWERFEFNKDAPLDDEEIEAAEDDTVLTRNIGQSFRFSAVEARREDQIRSAHDEAMFGARALPPSISSDSEPEGGNNDRENNDKETNREDLAASLLSETVLAKQRGSWRDRVREA